MSTRPEPKILIIDDEPHIRRFLDIAIRTQNYQTLLADTGLKGLEIFTQQDVNLIILDLGLPDIEGIEVLHTVREYSQTPVIVLSARPDEQQKVLLLDAGANDYVTKPFSIQELLARIRVHLRDEPMHHENNKIYDDGHLFVHFAEHTIRKNNQDIVLSKKEFELLALLMMKKGQIIPQRQIITKLWGSTHTEDTHYLRILVKKLRDKLDDSVNENKYIQTITGVGLRFNSIEKKDE